MAIKRVKPALPVIETGNPLAYKLLFDAAFFERGGTTARELIQGNKGALTNGPTWQLREPGSCIDIVPNNDQVLYSGFRGIGDLKQRTIEFLIRMEGGGTIGYGHAMQITDAAMSNVLIDIQNDNYSGGWGFIYYAGYTNRERIWSIPHLTLNVWSHVIIRHNYSGDYTVDPAPDIWVNGVKQSLTDRWNSATTYSFSSDLDVSIGNRRSADECWDGQIAHLRIWGRLLTDSEIQRIIANPYCFYRDKKQTLGKAPAGTAYTSTLTETVTIVDTINKQTSRILSEVATIVDTVVKSTSRAFLETATIVDSMVKSTSRTISEVVTVVDTILKQTARTMSETATIVDTVSKQSTKVLTETITIVDSILKSTARTITETVTIVDTVLKSLSRPFLETITVVDTITRDFSKTLSETVTVVDTSIKSFARTISETVTIVDEVTILKVAVLVLEETITVTDNITRSVYKTLSETVIVGDEIIKQLAKTIRETVTVADELVRSMTRSFLETIAIDDIFNRSLNKTFTETVTIVDTLTKQFSKTLSETVTLVDTLTTAVFSKMRKGATYLFTKANKVITVLKTRSKGILGTKSDDKNVLQ